jgi:hypothetical protein
MVAELKQLDRRSGFDRLVGVGRLVLEKFFDGSAAAWRERRKNKNNSVRRLALHPDCPFSHSSLNQALGVYVTVRALPCVQTFEHVASSHVVAVLHLPLQDQRTWLERAEIERWSVRQLKRELLEARRLCGERRGRPRASAAHADVARVKRNLYALSTALDALSGATLEEDDELELSDLREHLWKLGESERHRGRTPRRSELCPAPNAPVLPALRIVGSFGH